MSKADQAVEREEAFPFDSTTPSMSVWSRGYARLLDCMAAVSAAMIIFSMVTVTADVLLRFVFSKGLLWSFEVTEFLLLYIPMLAMPWLARRNGHIQIDLLLTSMPKRWAGLMNAASYAAVAALCIALAFWSGLATANSYERGIVNAGIVAWPRWALLIVMPPAFLLTAFEFVRHAWLQLKDGEAQ